MDIKLLPVTPQALPSSGAGTSATPATDGSFARLIGAVTGKLPQDGMSLDTRPQDGLPQPAGLAEVALEIRPNSHLDRPRNDPSEDQLEKDTDEPLIALIAMAQAIRPLDSAKALKPAIQEPLAVKQEASEIKGQALPAGRPLIHEVAGEMVESEAAKISQIQPTPAPSTTLQATTLNAARSSGDGVISPVAEKLEENLEGFDQLLDKAGSTSGLLRQDGTAAPLQGTGTAMSASGQAASPTITAPLQSPQWSQQLGQHLIALTQRGDQQMKLRLNPEELGPLSVTLKLSDQGAQAHFLSGHAQVRGLIEQAIPQLREALAQQGIALGETSVGDQGFQDNPRQGDGRQPGAGTRYFTVNKNDVASEPSLTSQPSSHLDDRVDLYA
ncbi:hypothetical protein FGL86_11905 [Pistricoccus aurantiacus]|uniref:Flagellar hook-length control protein-like C-terminal domain-containing protein n=1 Tax=Pistricoccus aurantiacus TaxID=1883414 RepID=A0A5B8STR4_9GAMM|nr:flagellar hook-length control protein FliK [Pistricoccus aurantiacus]QEA39701.1 hypothetical protein FGL86_11905 [Pistricoccus aurantiacus]